LDIAEEMYACFVDSQNASVCVNWTKLLQTPKGTAITWRQGRLTRNVYVDQSVKTRLDEGETRNVKVGIVLRGQG